METVKTESSSSPISDKEKQICLVEVSNMEKQLWALINSKGLSQPEVQNLYRHLCSKYERIILGTSSDIVNLQEVEYSLWKLHYKHIDEFRRQIKRGSARSSLHVEGLRLFLSDASEFYKRLLCKLLSQSTSKIFIEKESSEFLCHRILICLGDLARYKELFEKSKVEARDWSSAAGYYMEASRTYPYSGNPHNQLALLSTYIGDEFLALYHCVRSLAVKEPFPDAWNNLVLLLEKSRSSPLSLSSCEAFDFLKPSERSKSPVSISKPEDSADGQSGSGENKLWPLIVRLISYFFVKSSLDDFRSTFSATIKELEGLMDFDDTKLTEALKSNGFTDSTDVTPTRAIQAVCIFIFVIGNHSKSLLLRHSQEKNGTDHQLMLRQYAIPVTFIFMGRLIQRCLKTRPMNPCPLQPALLVFMEWLVNAFDEFRLHDHTEEEITGISYFFGNLVHLLNSLKSCKPELQPRDCAALWEDYELRGYTTLAKSYLSLDFSTSDAQSKSFQSGSQCRARRILFASRKIAEGSQKWILYDKFSGKFSTAMEREEKPVSLDEEEVILFKPLTRHNSAPLYESVSENGHLLDEEDFGDAVVPREECLRRTKTAREMKIFKQPESAISAGPPSLSGWVLNGGSSGVCSENRLSPLEELASASMANLSITSSAHVPESVHEAVITHCPSPPPPPPYSAPIPSAPLLPEDASWFTGAQPNYHDEPMDRTSGALHGSPGEFLNIAPHSPAGFLAYPATRGLSSSEWLRKFREINNLHPGNSQVSTPSNDLGNFGTFASPQLGTQIPLGYNQKVYLNQKPPLPPEYPQRPIPYGCGGVIPDPARDNQLSLLQYLKEREWRVQQDASRPGHTFLGK